MPKLEPDEYRRLKHDIMKHGVQTPALFTPDGLLVDGWNRIRICWRLGIECPTAVIELPEGLERATIRRLNLHERTMTSDMRSRIIQEQLIETPEMSDRAVARALGVSNSTVSGCHRALRMTGTVHVPAPADGVQGESSDGSRADTPVDGSSAASGEAVTAPMEASVSHLDAQTSPSDTQLSQPEPPAPPEAGQQSGSTGGLDSSPEVSESASADNGTLTTQTATLESPAAESGCPEEPVQVASRKYYTFESASSGQLTGEGSDLSAMIDRVTEQVRSSGQAAGTDADDLAAEVEAMAEDFLRKIQRSLLIHSPVLQQHADARMYVRRTLVRTEEAVRALGSRYSSGA